ncbi:MAG TPA: hypothetical protein VFA65_13340 [Bryobacteraceae bacterium]|nr:hypothetical protein [Bryobacteraceae bacterium]
MDTLRAELTQFESAKDLKTLLGVEGPCVTIYMPLAEGTANQAAKANALEWRELLRQMESKAQDYKSKGGSLLEPLKDWDAFFPEGPRQGQSIGIFRSANVFRLAWLSERVPSRAMVGPQFFIRPLLLELKRNKTFYLLALSQKNVRLLRCTMHSSEEVPLPQSVAVNFDEYMNTAKPDHVLDNRSSGGPDVGASKGVIFGTGAEREAKDQYLAHFYRQVDRGVNEVLRGQTEPVVLVGVDYEIALYRSLSKFPRLAEEAVEGAPNSLKAGEMHARAIDAIQRCYELKVNEAIAEYDHKVGAGATNRLKDVVTAAHDGRVLTLLVSNSLETTGVFDQTTHTVRGRQTGTSEDEDLVNDAVIQTILHGGQVFVAPNGKMPQGSPVAAIYRF